MVGGVVRMGLIGLTLWLLLVGLAWVFQDRLIYLPDTAPVAAPLGVEDVQLTTDDGLQLTAWFVPADGEAVSTVLVTPGNAGSRALRLPLAEGLAARGHHVLLLDYRGYAGNPGSPDQDGLLADGRAAHDHLVDRDDVDPDRIVHLGESIGTGVAAGLSSDRPPVAVVLRSPFTDLGEAGARAYPFLPVRTLLRDRFPVIDPVVAYAGPVLVVAGSGDRIVPLELSEQVADAADAQLEVLPGVGHNDRELLDGADYLDAVDAFVRDHLG